MAFGSGQWGPEALIKLTSSTTYGPLTSPSATASSGYTATVSNGNITVVGPVGSCTVTVSDSGTTVGTFTVLVEPVPSDLTTLRSDVDGHTTSIASNTSNITTNTSAISTINTTLGTNPQGTDASVAARLTRMDGVSSATVMFVRKTTGGTWPARPTASTSVLVFWDGPPAADGSGPPTVTSGTGGMLPGDKWLSYPSS